MGDPAKQAGRRAVERLDPARIVVRWCLPIQHLQLVADDLYAERGFPERARQQQGDYFRRRDFLEALRHESPIREFRRSPTAARGRTARRAMNFRTKAGRWYRMRRNSGDRSCDDVARPEVPTVQPEAYRRSSSISLRALSWASAVRGAAPEPKKKFH